MIGRVLRGIGVGAVIVALLGLIIYSMSVKPPLSSEVWDAKFTIGNADTAKLHYVMYTDIMCPYCDVLAREVHDHSDEFLKFIEENEIVYEVRVTDFLYEYGAHATEYSRQSAEAAYCAADEGKFFEFYYATLDKLYEDFHSKGVGTGKTSKAITGIDDNYWLKIGESVGLSADFAACYATGAKLATIQANTARAAKVVGGGLPYFQFGNFANGGFDQSWDWSMVKQYLEQGLKSK